MTRMSQVGHAYREGFDKPEALTPGAPLSYRFALPTVSHVLLPGHRLMVQIQSSWFPLYDRNPQTFVPSIFQAQPSDYKPGKPRHAYAKFCRRYMPTPPTVRPVTTIADRSPPGT